MNQIRRIIKETLILERKISQLSDTFKVSFGFDVFTFKHANDRMNLGRAGISNRVISNKEINYVIDKYKRDIAEKIINGYIKNDDEFVIKDSETKIDCVIIANIIGDYYWSLIVKTVFPSSENFSLFVGQDQLVLSK